MLKNVHKSAVIISVLVSVYLKFLLLPTANLAFELYHLSNIDFIYHVYSGFKIGAYIFDNWAYQNLTCIVFALVVFFVLHLKAQRKQKRQLS
jgi:hypothetical protein